MKHFIALLLLLPFSAFAQDCKVKKEIDKFSQKPKVTTGFFPLSEGMNRVLLSIEANSTEIDFFFSFGNSGESKCFDNSSTATILYDSTRLKSNYKNTGSMNCDGLFHFTFRNVPTLPSGLKKLATTKVGSIQLKGNNDMITEIPLTQKDKETLMQMVDCIIKEAPSLRTQ